MLGTSRAGFGFHGRKAEEQLSAALGRPAIAFNFGVPASGPVTHLIYFRRLLADGHRPDLLLLEVLPSSLAEQEEGPTEQKFLSGDRLCRSELPLAVGYGFPADRTHASWRASVALPWYNLRFPVLGRAAAGWLPWAYRQDWGRTVDDHGWLCPITTELSPEARARGLAQARLEYAGYLAAMTPGGGAGRRWRT